MKRIFAAALALSVLAVPAAQAQQGPHRQDHRIEKKYERNQGPKHQQDRHKFDRHKQPQKQDFRTGGRDGNAYRGHDPRRPNWAKGQRVPNWQRQQHVRDWHRHGLRRPGPGQQWVRVGNDYLLVSVMSGLIIGLMAGR